MDRYGLVKESITICIHQSKEWKWEDTPMNTGLLQLHKRSKRTLAAHVSSPKVKYK